MSRRKKEPQEAHQQAISSAAERLFSSKGSLQSVTMDEIAREAGYSKATLYVYFQNKEEIVSFLILNSMQMLQKHLDAAVQGTCATLEKYRRICHALVSYQEEFPLYFSLSLGEIRVGTQQDSPSIEQETYAVGERINQTLVCFLQEGITRGALRDDLVLLPTVLLFWASLSGLILTAANKSVYFEQATGLSHSQFLAFGFETLYHSIEAKRSEP